MASLTLRRPHRRDPAAPSLDLDLYSDRVVEDSAEAFARIRDAGPVVWLPRQRMWALGRYEELTARPLPSGYLSRQ